MPLFTSTRERRLWAWALVVVVAIYATLDLARTLTGLLRDRGLLSDSFFFGMILIGFSIVALALKTRPGGVEIGIGLGVTAVYLFVLLRMLSPEERSHIIEYGVVAVLIYEALKERVSQGRFVPVPALLAVLATGLIGLLDECIQVFLPSRVFDLFDIIFNILAALMAVLASMALVWARRWRE